MNTIKLILVALLFVCLAKMPYGYYELMRTIAIVGFMILGYEVYLQKRKAETLIYIIFTLLFQPFFKVALGRELWNIIDIIVAIWLLFTICSSRRQHNNKMKIEDRKEQRLFKHKD
jgi:predicted membrane protein